MWWRHVLCKFLQKILQKICKNAKCQQGPNAFCQLSLIQSLLIFYFNGPSKGALGTPVNDVMHQSQLRTCQCYQSRNPAKVSGGKEWTVGESGGERGEAGQQVIYIALCPCFIYRNKQKLCHHRQHVWYEVMADPREWLERFTNLPLPSSSFHVSIIDKETNASPRGTGASCWYRLCSVSWHHGGKVHIALALWGLKIIMWLMLVIQWQDDNFALCLF